MSNYMVNNILESLSNISEAKQKLWYIEYKAKGITDAKLLCNSQSYNKNSKLLQGYNEIFKSEVTNDSEKSFYTSKIRNELEDRYGIKDFKGDNTGWDVETKDGYGCMIVGKYKTNNYGYQVYDTKISESIDEGIKMVEADADAQYKVYRETGKYPEKTIVKAVWELEKADDNNIFLIKDGKKRKFKVIPDNRGMHGFVGKPMKTGVKAVGGVDGFIEAMTKEIKNGPGGYSTIAGNIFNGIWDTCKDVK